jgi:hypothetical protein
MRMCERPQLEHNEVDSDRFFAYMICSNEFEIVVFLEDMVYMVILMVSIK